VTITMADAVVRRHLNYISLASKLIKSYNEFLHITFLNYEMGNSRCNLWRSFRCDQSQHTFQAL